MISLSSSGCQSIMTFPISVAVMGCLRSMVPARRLSLSSFVWCVVAGAVCSIQRFRDYTFDGTNVKILAVNNDFENKLYILSTLNNAIPAFTVDQKKEHFKTI